MVKPVNTRTLCAKDKNALIRRSSIETKHMSASLHSKASDLEEELKNVTNNLKSLEAQSEKVRVTGPCNRNTFTHL